MKGDPVPVKVPRRCKARLAICTYMRPFLLVYTPNVLDKVGFGCKILRAEVAGPTHLRRVKNGFEIHLTINRGVFMPSKRPYIYKEKKKLR